MQATTPKPNGPAEIRIGKALDEAEEMMASGWWKRNGATVAELGFMAIALGFLIWAVWPK